MNLIALADLLVVLCRLKALASFAYAFSEQEAKELALASHFGNGVETNVQY